MPTARRLQISLAAAGLLACAGPPNPQTGQGMSWPQQLAFEFRAQPDSAPGRWAGLIGEYGPDTTIRWIVLERENRLWVLDQRGNYVPLGELSDSTFQAPRTTALVSGNLLFNRDATGRATSVQLADMVMARRVIEPPSGANQLRITPVRPIDELRREALAARPPAETGFVRQPDLVDVAALDSTIKLEVRYAGTNNFLGSRIYDAERAFLQRPAADALLRAHRALRPLGYGLVIHDAYRPWYATKIFWDATPDSLRWLVADPTQGSKHNRGAAVDVTLYELQSGRTVRMPSTYDESTTRAAANYPGGTELQRWHRALLRRAMEHEGFVAIPQEWWHFDHRDWRSYPLLNVPFDQVRPAAAAAPR